MSLAYELKYAIYYILMLRLTKAKLADKVVASWDMPQYKVKVSRTPRFLLADRLKPYIFH